MRIRKSLFIAIIIATLIFLVSCFGDYDTNIVGYRKYFLKPENNIKVLDGIDNNSYNNSKLMSGPLDDCFVEKVSNELFFLIENALVKMNEDTTELISDRCECFCSDQNEMVYAERTDFYGECLIKKYYKNTSKKYYSSLSFNYHDDNEIAYNNGTVYSTFRLSNEKITDEKGSPFMAGSDTYFYRATAVDYNGEINKYNFTSHRIVCDNNEILFIDDLGSLSIYNLSDGLIFEKKYPRGDIIHYVSYYDGYFYVVHYQYESSESYNITGLKIDKIDIYSKKTEIYDIYDLVIKHTKKVRGTEFLMYRNFLYFYIRNNNSTFFYRLDLNTFISEKVLELKYDVQSINIINENGIFIQTIQSLKDTADNSYSHYTVYYYDFNETTELFSIDEYLG